MHIPVFFLILLDLLSCAKSVLSSQDIDPKSLADQICEINIINDIFKGSSSHHSELMDGTQIESFIEQPPLVYGDGGDKRETLDDNLAQFEVDTSNLSSDSFYSNVELAIIVLLYSERLTIDIDKDYIKLLFDILLELKEGKGHDTQYLEVLYDHSASKLKDPFLELYIQKHPAHALLFVWVISKIQWLNEQLQKTPSFELNKERASCLCERFASSMDLFKQGSSPSSSPSHRSIPKNLEIYTEFIEKVKGKLEVYSTVMKRITSFFLGKLFSENGTEEIQKLMDQNFDQTNLFSLKLRPKLLVAASSSSYKKLFDKIQKVKGDESDEDHLKPLLHQKTLSSISGIEKGKSLLEKFSNLILHKSFKKLEKSKTASGEDYHSNFTIIPLYVDSPNSNLLGKDSNVPRHRIVHQHWIMECRGRDEISLVLYGDEHVKSLSIVDKRPFPVKLSYLHEGQEMELERKPLLKLRYRRVKSDYVSKAYSTINLWDLSQKIAIAGKKEFIIKGIPFGAIIGLSSEKLVVTSEFLRVAVQSDKTERQRFIKYAKDPHTVFVGSIEERRKSH